MKRLPAITVLGALALLAACAPAPPQSPAGTVTGRLVLEGGPLGQAGPRPIRGTVQFTGHHRRAAAQVGSSGNFSIRLPVGTYNVSARSPSVIEVSDGTHRQVPCSQPLAVTITPLHITTITLTCIVP
jgi:hypothetical protein